MLIVFLQRSAILGLHPFQWCAALTTKTLQTTGRCSKGTAPSCQLPPYPQLPPHPQPRTLIGIPDIRKTCKPCSCGVYTGPMNAHVVLSSGIVKPQNPKPLMLNPKPQNLNPEP